ncbi:MAG TPA: phage head-tail connector protein [Devosiaceae bacterium]|nr:phage head-tail connector protein [Devosiaceae bacterium]
MTSYLLSGPAAEPVTLDEAKVFLRLDAADEDALVATLITAARVHVESITGRALLPQGWRLVLDRWPADGLVKLPVGPLQSLTAMTSYDDAGTPTSLPVNDVLIAANASPPQLFLPPGFGTPMLRLRQGIEIDYLAGYGTDPADVPAPLRQALLALVAYWFENRDSVILAGAGTVIPSGFDLMVAPYRQVRL